MAFRRPLYYSAGNLTEMTDSMIGDIRTAMYAQYIGSPSVILDAVSTGGNLGTLYDTRMIAGLPYVGTTDYPPESVTGEPSAVSIGYSRINQTVSSVSAPADTNSVRYPCYYTSGGNIQSMTLQDMYDTFAYDTIDSLVSGSTMYSISTSPPASWPVIGWATSGGGINVFSDSRADTSLYTADGIYEAYDQPIYLTNYFMFYVSSFSYPSTTQPVVINSAGNLVSASDTDFYATLRDIIQYVAANVSGYRIRYSINGSGNNCGTGMTDTRLNGSGSYNTRYVDTDDYRAQEFPDGSSVAISTYYLRVRKE